MSKKTRRPMHRSKRRHAIVPGAPPGVVKHDPEAPRPKITALCYGPKDLEEVAIDDPAQLAALKAKHPVTWIRIEGLGDAELLKKVGEIFGLHLLALEDIVSPNQRPKVEEYEGHYFVLMRKLQLVEKLINEQIGIFFSDRFVVTFLESADTMLDPVRARIRASNGRIRTAGADYLAYAIMDAVVDNYFPVIEGYGDRLEAIEETILDFSNKDVLAMIQDANRDLLAIKRAVWPVREAINRLFPDPLGIISKMTRLYLRDCQDHAVQLIDLIESYRDLAVSLADLFFTTTANKTNDIMKVLTMIATIFIPLSFIVGMYGMNFSTAASPYNMPELNWRYGYPAILLFMLAVVGGLLVYFRRKGWLGHPPGAKEHFTELLRRFGPEFTLFGGEKKKR